MSDEKKSLFIIFGGTGDLARRKLYPSLYLLYKKGYLKEHFAVIGTARREWSDDHYQQIVMECIEDIQESPEDAQAFASHFRYQSHNVKDAHHYDTLKALADDLDEEYGLEGNRIYYLAMSPNFFGLIAENLKNQQLLSKDGFNRLIIEKPFGEDYDSAQELQDHLLRSFDEDQIYRIDHYLGKEMVQSILPVRFGNQMISDIWHHEYIDNIQITLSEKLGVEERGGYYDSTGALKDMVQNHVLQLVALLAMEPPASLDAEDIQKEKVRVLNSLPRFSSQEASEWFVRGQYGSSELQTPQLPAYREENQVEPDSNTETYVAGKITIGTDRWKNVPFYIRTGKRMPSKTARVDIVMKNSGIRLFNQETDMPPSILTLHLDPVKGWSLQLNSKKIGPGLEIQSEPLTHFIDEDTAREVPEAYEKLLLDSLNGDKTYFVHWDEVAASWSFIDPIREAWNDSMAQFPNYSSRSLGPDESHNLLEKDGRRWIWYPEK